MASGFESSTDIYVWFDPSVVPGICMSKKASVGVGSPYSPVGPVQGEVPDNFFGSASGGGPNTIGISDFNLSLSGPPLAGAQGSDPSDDTNSNRGKGLSKFGACTINKLVDSASTALMTLSNTGSTIPNVIIAVRKTVSGSPMIYLQYLLRSVKVTNVGWSLGDPHPTEKVELEFESMGLSYAQHNPNAKGGIGSTAICEWNDQLNDETVAVQNEASTQGFPPKKYFPVFTS